MSFSTVIRQRCSSAAIARRHVSSNAANTVQSHRTLPDAKMRALIALYHQSENFITLDNLSQRIDEAFVPQSKLAETVSRQTLTMRDMENALRERRNAPKAADWDDFSVSHRASAQMGDMNWSSWKTARENRVIEALYGTNSVSSQNVQPGLEVLEDAEKPPVTVIPEEDLEDALKGNVTEKAQ